MLERFIEEYAEKGFQAAYRLCGSSEEAKELAQEAFTRLISRWERYDSSQPLENWFMTILRNVYYDSLRRYERKHAVPLDAPAGEHGGLSYADVLEDQDEEPLLRTLERRENAALVREALAGLTAEHRAILTLGDLEGLGYEELARALDCPLGTVRSRLFRARAAFKKALLRRGREVVE